MASNSVGAQDRRPRLTLVVDDDEVNLLVMKMHMEQMGYATLIARSGNRKGGNGWPRPDHDGSQHARDGRHRRCPGNPGEHGAERPCNRCSERTRDATAQGSLRRGRIRGLHRETHHAAGSAARHSHRFTVN